MSNKLSEQYILFENQKSELDCVWEAVTKLQDSQNSVRKRLFGEIEELKVLLNETRASNEKIMWLLGCGGQQEERTVTMQN